MKNKILPLSLVTLVICLGAFLISATVVNPFSFSDDQEQRAEETLFSNYLTKIRANQNTQLVDAADVLNANSQAAANLKNAIMADFDWQFLGPNNAGGFTRALLYDNMDETSKTIIAGALTGGLYKSTNSGLTWNKINGIENNLKVTSIVQASDGTIYAGTGGLFMGTGIYKSTDGENFALIPSTDPYVAGGNAAFAEVNRLAVADGVIYASTQMGLWYSSDNGASWAMAQSDGADLGGYSTDVNIGSNGLVAASMDGLCYITTGNPNNFVLHSSDTFNLPYEDVANLELAIAPSNPDVLYATVLDDNDELINIYRSDDAGVHWRIIGPGDSPSLNVTYTPENNVITVFPSNEDRVLIGGNNMWEGTKLSETGFFQWVRKSTGGLPAAFEPSYIHTWHNIYVFRPGNEQELLIGHDGGISKGSINSINFEFVELNKTYITSQAMTIGFGGLPKVVFAGYDQNGVQYINGHTNPDLAKNGLQVWTGPTEPPYGGNGSEVFLSVIDPNVVIYSAENGEFRRSEDLGENASTTFLSSSITFPDDYYAPALYWESFDNEDSRDTVGVNITETIPAGTEMWLFSNNRGYPFMHTAETTYNPGDSILVKDPVSSKLFIGSEKVVWMTTEILDFTAEPEWFQISNYTEAGLDGVVSSMGMSKDANFVFVGTEEGRLYRIANISLAYDYDRADVRSPFCIISTAEIPVINPSTGAQNEQIITSVAVDPQDPAHVIITMGNFGNGNYIYRSTNALDANPEFTSIQGDLPKMPIYSSIIEMSNSNMCIIGTENGIYESSNIGGTVTWTPSYGITGQVPVMQIKQQLIAQEEITLWYFDGVDTTFVVYPGTYNFGNIYTATYGRGLFYSNKYQKPVGIISQDMPELQANISVYPNPVRNVANIEYTLDSQTDIIISVFDINGRMVAQENLNRMAGTHQYKLDCSTLPGGMYVVSVQAGKTVETSKFIVAQ